MDAVGVLREDAPGVVANARRCDIVDAICVVWWQKPSAAAEAGCFTDDLDHGYNEL
jgi:hypothetical protein